MGTGGAGGSEGVGGNQGVGGSSAGSSGVGGNGGVSGGPGTGGSAGQGGGGGGSVDAGVDFTACDGPGQCVAVEATCCGTCGVPQLVNFVGLNAKQVQAYHQEKCPLPVPCPACAQGTNPNIAARCDSGHCKVFDVTKVSEYSGCSTDSDCHLRSGLGCCVCNGPDSAAWVSVNQSGEQAISKIMCAPMTGCAACVPVPPPGYAAFCNVGVCGIKH